MAKPQIWKALCLIALFSPVAACCQEASRIPATHGTTLAGTQVTLPDGLKAKLSIVVVGFSHQSEEQISNWGRLISADYGKSADICYFELAMLGGVPKLVRGMIVKRLASSVPFDERDHYVPVPEGEPAWRSVAHYNKPEDAYVLLLDRNGTVLWQTEGEPTNAAYGAFKAQVAKTLKAQADRDRSASESTSPH